MIYFILFISVLTFCFSWYILYKMTIFVDKYVSRPSASYIPFRQSTVHGFNKQYMPTNQQINKALNDLSPMYADMGNDKNKIKVIIFNNMAYWIHENIFYSSQLKPNGDIDAETARPINVEGMSEKEVDLLMSILDDLRGQEDDGSSSGK